ncbi:putative iron-dependent peroxidase [Rheinheimera pacifica]|uniref:Dyp-type peroxidase n=1 Tax=Rheinheimera pacifica TaxID=173990 RepID=UPI00216A180F|nr:Dyp-type peroxidase [Rheinheimera pacifica]MCS4306671.1 putative iron-dependent peroxidase [Rheinheimera pacifica]
MAREQLGICTEANLHGSYLFFNAQEGHERVLRHKLARLPQLFDRLATHFSEALLTSVVAIGSNYWDTLYPDARPAGLGPFPELPTEDIDLAPVPLDLLIQIRSDRLDVNFIASQQVLQLLQGHAELQEHIQGFRYLDGRSLTGFIDAPGNPKGKAKRIAALVDHIQQPVFAGGSYLYLHCFNFDFSSWQQLNTQQQEEIMGMDKVSGKPLLPALQAADSHYVVMQPDTAQGLFLQQNMPFSQPKVQGMLQLSYCADADVLLQQLKRRVGLAEQNQGYDQLLNYNRIDFSAAFFVPSISFLELAAKL